MPRITYVEKRFSSSSTSIIQTANDILEEYDAQGYKLTLRQLYYQFVARGLMDNRQTEYKRLGSIINDARLAGLIDWDRIEDRTRFLRGLRHWDGPADILRDSAKEFRYDIWRDQEVRVEVWIEKDALIGVIENTCNQYDIPYFACRGYASQSEMWRAGRRALYHKQVNEQDTVVLHFGDHDPSGMDMTRDNDDRLNMFSRHGVDVRRMALNMDQVDKYGPPPNPAKMTDSRAGDYVAEYGYESWELDALEPSVINDLISDQLGGIIDWDAWNEVVGRQEDDRTRLREIADNWNS